MSGQTRQQLEELLERMGSVGIPDDPVHRYALRRALLNSPRFEKNRFRIVWTRLFMYTTSLVAGGAVVVVLVVSIMTVELPEGRSSVVVKQPTTRTIEQPTTVQEVLDFAKPRMEFAVSR